MKEFDVIVVGGGISGVIAAVAASRNGMKTLVVESAGYLGGALTVNSVAPMMTFHAGKEQVVKGITDELISRLQAKGKSTGHVFSSDPNTATSTFTFFDQEAMKYELELMLLESGVELLYHSMLAKVTMKDKEIDFITVCNKAGLMDLKGKIYIDATGDADLTVMSGTGYDKGRPEDGKTQPMTLMVKFENVDTDKVREFIRQNPDSFPQFGSVEYLLNREQLCPEGFVNEMKKAKEAGEISIPRDNILFFESSNKGEIYFNTTRIINHDPTDPWSLSEAETIGRKQAWELDRFVRKYIPGFEHALMVQTGPKVGVRSSRQLQGQYQLTEQDILNETIFEDGVALCGYYIDIHSPEGEGTKHVTLRKGAKYSIPYRCLVPKETTNLLVCGRSISATFTAQAAIRTTPTVGAMGQAAGTAAALAVRDQVKVQNVDTKELCRILKEQGAVLS